MADALSSIGLPGKSLNSSTKQVSAFVTLTSSCTESEHWQLKKVKLPVTEVPQQPQ